MCAATRLGPYELIAPIGAGGMGEVYRARDPRIGREVAVKVLPAQFAADRERLMRFEQEARAAGALNHPNLVAIYDIGTHEGQPYIVEELLEGETLRQRLHGGAIGMRRSVDYAIQIARGLAAAHAKGVIHRDLKPENIFITSDGRLKILDFGLAKLTSPDSDDGSTTTRETQPGQVMGTASYMSPEQVRGERVDSRSDVFSFGCVLYEMLTGVRAFDAASRVETMNAILIYEPREIANMTPALARIVNKCLEKHPEARFQSASDLAFHLEAISDISAPAAPAKRRAYWPLWVALLAAATIAVTIWSLARRRQPQSADDLIIQRITNSGNVGAAAVSHDGKYVAFTTTGDGMEALSVLQLSTGSQVQIIPAAAVSYDSLGFSSDDDYIYFARHSAAGPWSLYRIPTLGGSEMKALESPLPSSAFALSPDNRSVAVIAVPAWLGPGELRIISLESGSVRIAATRKGREFLRNAKPAWSPDGTQLGYFAGTWEPHWHAQVFVAELRKGRSALLTRDEWSPLGGALAWTRDGQGLILSASKSDSASRQLWSVRVVDGAARPVTHDLASYYDATVTDEGTALVSRRSESDSNLWIVDATNAQSARQITFSTGASYAGWGIDWLPNGRIMYSLLEPDNGELWVISPDGKQPTRVTNTRGRSNLYPALSPDGKRVAFTSERSGRWMLWLMDVDGGNAHMFQHCARGKHPVWSPNGRWIVYNGDSDDAWRVSAANLDARPQRLNPDPCLFPAVTADSRHVLCKAPQTAARPARTILIPIDGGSARDTDLPPTTTSYRWKKNDEVAYSVSEKGVTNIWVRPFRGGKARQLTRFDSGGLSDFAFSPDDSRVVVSRVHLQSDAVLIRNFRSGR
jgi:serine/threonine protein kinase